MRKSVYRQHLFIEASAPSIIAACDATDRGDENLSRRCHYRVVYPDLKSPRKYLSSIFLSMLSHIYTFIESRPHIKSRPAMILKNRY